MNESESNKETGGGGNKINESAESALIKSKLLNTLFLVCTRLLCWAKSARAHNIPSHPLQEGEEEGGRLALNSDAYV